MEPTNDERLWRLARRRAAFKRHLYIYLVINAFLWAIWWFTTGHRNGSYPWPVWAMLGWGVGLGFQYFDAYSGNKQDMAIEEFKKLKKEEEQ